MVTKNNSLHPCTGLVVTGKLKYGLLRQGITGFILMLFMAIIYTGCESPAANLSAPAAELLELLDQRVDDEAVELGARLVQEYPDDSALHALYAISLIGASRSVEALRLSEEYVARWPDDAWVQVARGYWLRRDREKALGAATRARQLAPDDADIAAYVMSIYTMNGAPEQAVALADSFIASGRATPGLRLAKVAALRRIAARADRPDTTAATMARRQIERALAETPPSAEAHRMAGFQFMQDRRPADALQVLERAVEISPRSASIRATYWAAIGAQTDLTEDEKRAMIDADIEAYLGRTAAAVGARLAVAGHLRWSDAELYGAMADLIQRDNAGTWQAAKVAYDHAFFKASLARKKATTRADSIAVDVQLQEMLRAITAMPGASSGLLRQAYGDLFGMLQRDSTSSGEELLYVFNSLQENSIWIEPRRYVALPIALAERGSHLDYAEQLARAGLEVLEDDIESRRARLTVAEYANELDRVRSTYHATIGWVLFHKGDLAEAKVELEKAHEALDTEPDSPYRLGRIAEAEGNIEEAERWYATVLNPRSRAALDRLYLARNESLEGFDTYLGAIETRDIARRRTLIEAQRIATPQPLPAFDHEWINGGRFTSKALDGKIAVVYFWGVWCGPCVRSAPQTQAFAEKFRDHPDVVFITVANDVDPDNTRDFMKERGYDFPVILDEGLVRMVNIFAFPTTLFVDRNGRIVFRYSGSGPRLVEEYTWHVESLLGQTVAEGAGD